MTPEIEHIQRALALSGGGSSDFDLNPNVTLPKGRVLRPAAVLIPLIYVGDELRLILTKRASHLKHHPGQIAFPGGKLTPKMRMQRPPRCAKRGRKLAFRKKAFLSLVNCLRMKR